MTYNRITIIQLEVDRANHMTFILLGAAGDLAAKKTFPSLFKLYLGHYLPHNLAPPLIRPLTLALALALTPAPTPTAPYPKPKP